ncbi:TolC family protein [Piscinibacter sp. HJYY11]|uniref:TolC family protein n=1 Tax=Piscinibacter sp. HJYY11 TaxID=2801333 RepID=UPI00191CCBA3|nr:TolC family protein [Piscinibacter sp. HJYY11]MBL0726496.1 TolC family protein [Piscinibacter sp. HJYY11]
MKHTHQRRGRLGAAVAAALVFTGCASFSPDGGMGTVSELTRARTGQAVTAQRSPQEADSAKARIAEILKAPLSADGAVELALLNNRGLQASFSQLGVAEAELVQAGRLRNPVFSFGRMAAAGVVEIERAIMFDVLSLLTMPIAKEVRQRQFEQAQFQAAYDAVGIASDTRRAYFNAVASQELVGYFRQVKEAADASNELAKRMLRAGNFNKLAQMREQSFYADATAGLARAQQQALADRERLTRLLGVSGEQLGFTLPERLPELPQAPAEPKDAEQTALDKRLDVLMAKRSTDATAKSLGLTRVTRFVNALEVGYQNKSETDSPRANGFELELSVPLFDFGDVRTRRAEATYMQAVHRTAEVALNARSEVRESYGAYRTAYDLARHYRDEVVPLRKRISEENLLRYNGMLIGVFELLADSREQVRSVTEYVQALRDFWVAETHLQTAVTGRSPGASAAPSTTSAAGSEQPAGH